MPELPEVEVVRQTLKCQVVGRTILKIECFFPKIIDQNPNVFYTNVVGKKILDVNRYGKYLLFQFEDGVMVSHLRMEGKYFYLPQTKCPMKHTHVIFFLDNGYSLCYNDVRKFGRIVFRKKEELFRIPPLSKLGQEANQPVDISSLYLMIHKSSKTIKEILLDQRILCGLGNIYVDEVLFAAHISPKRLGFYISYEEVENLSVCSQRILNEAIAKKGTTIRSYTSSLGVFGTYQNFLQVHTKTICPICQKTLTKEKIGGRTTYYCSDCQQ